MMMQPSTANVWSFADLRFPWWPAVSAIALAAVMLGVAITSLGERDAGSAPAETPAAIEVARRPIPLEWRWAPRAVETDHMFRRAAIPWRGRVRL
jgi:hypothetical protein